MLIQHIVDAVEIIKGHRYRRAKGQKHHHHHGQVVIALSRLQLPGRLQLKLKLLPELGACYPPKYQHKRRGNQVLGGVSHPDQVAQGIFGPVPCLRKQYKQGGIDQQGVYGLSQIGDDPHPKSGKAGLSAGQIQHPHNEAKQRTRPHAEEKAFQRPPAEEGGEELVKVHHIVG